MPSASATCSVVNHPANGVVVITLPNRSLDLAGHHLDRQPLVGPRAIDLDRHVVIVGLCNSGESGAGVMDGTDGEGVAGGRRVSGLHVRCPFVLPFPYFVTTIIPHAVMIVKRLRISCPNRVCVCKSWIESVDTVNTNVYS